MKDETREYLVTEVETLQEKMAGLRTLTAELSREPSLPAWQEKFIIFPGETPWWEIKDRIEKTAVRQRQSRRYLRKAYPERYAAEQREYHKNHPGYAAEKTRKSRERHPGRQAEEQRRYQERYPGRRLEITKKFKGTPKGKAVKARWRAKRREWSTNPALYAARIELLHTLQEPCAICQTPYKITHQVDHILALCLGGTDNWDNLRPLCVLCHRQKTAEDLAELASRPAVTHTASFDNLRHRLRGVHDD